ncbi:UDP-2,3-diacylglucosamine diphosphatase, partial [Streptococcus danieliae]|nr:UDP-2,3-diacylglucosamine diphosphatase [Streptococcus danieliae]
MPAGWRTLEFISDLHLQASEPATVQAFRNYLAATRADAVFLLGDLFEVWVGDDALLEPGSFEAECATAMRAAATRTPLFFMQGNRDFLTGAQFDALCGTTTLTDPTVLDCGDQRILLSHGDALCLDDVDYQRFRAMARSAAWQAAE